MIMHYHKQGEEQPAFTGFVNAIIEREMKNGGTMTTYMVGTRDKKQDGTYEYSTWPCTLMGEAKSVPIAKGDRIAVYGWKQTNISRKNEDGTFSKPYFNMMIGRFENLTNGASGGTEEEAY